MRFCVFLCVSAAYAAQSVQVTDGAFNASLGDPYAAGNRSMRWEFRIDGLKPGCGIPMVSYGFIGFAGAQISGNDAAPNPKLPGCSLQIAWGSPSAGRDVYYAAVLDNTRLGDGVLGRIQRDTVGSNCAGSACYTVEICDVKGGNCQSLTSPITTLAASWTYSPNIGIKSDPKDSASVAFVRWYSAVVPVGTTIPIAGPNGDLGDWEYEQNGNDGSPAGRTMSGGTIRYVPTPKFPPNCDPGVQQSFRAGFPGALDGSKSSPLDGGTALTHQWQQITGPTSVQWTVPPNSPKPQFTSMMWGSYNFQLTVTDGSGQSASCVVHDGAVVTDSQAAVILPNPKLRSLLGIPIRWGMNDWPWFDDRHKGVSDNNIQAMDTTYPNFWDTAATGTVSVTKGSNILVGKGTHFTTELCNGSEPKGLMVIVWWNGGANRRGNFARSCTDDTHAVLDPDFYTWSLPSESGLKYSIDVNNAAYKWQFGMNAGSPNNYYDNVAAYYSLYYRSGIDTYLTAARKLADEWFACPMMDQGWAFKPGSMSSIAYGAGRTWSALGLVLRALDGRPDMWALLHAFYNQDAYHAGANTDWVYWGMPGMWDQREQAYEGWRLAQCALFDPDPAYGGNTGKCKAAIVTLFDALWKPVHENFQNFAFPGWWGDRGTAAVSTLYVVATHGSNTIVLHGGTWSAADFAGDGVQSFIWMWPCIGAAGESGGCVRPNTNAGGDPTAYYAHYVDGTHATLTTLLNAPTTYQGPTGSKGWTMVTGGPQGLGWGEQPFMLGIIASSLELQAAAMADADYQPELATTLHQYAAGTTQYLIDRGIRASTKGLYYQIDTVTCPSPVPENYGWCTGSGTPTNPGPSRILSAEAVWGMMQSWFNFSHDASVKSAIDLLYNAEWAKPNTCPAGSTVCVSDGYYIDGYDQGGGFDVGPKWLGMGFGMNAQAAWPAMRRAYADVAKTQSVVGK